MLKLDLCTGNVRREGFIHIDKNAQTEPDVVLDICKEKLPYEDHTVDEIYFMHGIEHIKRPYWDFVLREILRALKPFGRVVFGYPEFKVCAYNYLTNNKEQRHFWLQCLYGRQLWEGDEHVTAVDSHEFKQILESYGYFRVAFDKESERDYYYSITVAFKDPEFQHKETLMASELGLGECVEIFDLINK